MQGSALVASGSGCKAYFLLPLKHGPLQTHCAILGRDAIYMEDLQALDGVRPPPPEKFRQVVSPLNVGAWQRHLAGHPDEDFARYLIRGFLEGFHIGFDRRARGGIIDAYLASEVQLQRVVALPSSGSQIYRSAPSV